MQDPRQHSLKCANCINYRWEQPSDSSKIKRCSKCQILNYCSKECQTEHWRKIQKYHCGFLAGTKTQSNVRHSADCCQYCIKENMISEKMNRNIENRYLGCPWYMNDKVRKFKDEQITILGTSVISPFQLGEITGHFQSLIEHSLVTLLRLQNKMRLCYGYFDKDSVRTILEMREVLRTTYCFVETENSQNLHIYYQHNIKLSCLLYKLCQQNLKKLRSEFNSKKLNDKMKLLDTYQLMIGFLEFHFSADDISHGVPKDYIQITYDCIEEVWKKSINILESETWTYEELANTFCKGASCPKCYNCSKHISAINRAFWLDTVETSLNRNLPSAYVIIATPLRSLIFVCGDNNCVKGFYEKISIHIKDLNCSPNRCDACFKHVRKMHRCSKCLTKIYCGQDCLNQDWNIHKDLCTKILRKQKMDKKQRQIDHDAFNKFLSALSSIKVS